MNYSRIYSQLIAKAQQTPPEGYSEEHHIVPHCMGGDDSPSNLVRLTPEQHLVAHLLLVKIHPGHLGTLAAAVMMSGRKRYSNKKYGWVKRQMSERAKNRRHTTESKKKMSDARKGKKKSDEHETNRQAAMHTQEYSDKMSAACKKVQKTAEWNKKNSDAIKAHWVIRKAKLNSHK